MEEQFLKAQKATEKYFSMRLEEAKTRDFFTAHEAACLWLELWDECNIAKDYLLNCRDLSEARLQAGLVEADSFTKYVILRSAIESKIRAHCGRLSASSSMPDAEADNKNLHNNGCMMFIDPDRSLISKPLLIEIADAMNARPRFLFIDASRLELSADAKPLATAEEADTTLHIPDGIDQSVADRLQAMIDAANYYWGKNGCADGGSTNSVIGKWIGKKVDVSPTVAEQMAAITRPDYAKIKTWADNKKHN